MKWRAYLDWCDKFLFCMTEEVYGKLKDELPKDVGVVCLSETTGFAYMAKKCGTQDLSDENRLSVLARLAWRQGDLSKRTSRRQRVWLSDPPETLPPKKKSKRTGGKTWQKRKARAAKMAKRETDTRERLNKALDTLLEKNR